MRQRLDPGERKLSILQAAVDLACATSYREITRREVAVRAAASEGLVNLYFADMDGLRAALMRYAVENAIFPIIIQGIGAKDPIALAASVAIKRRAARWIEREVSAK